MVKKVGNTLKPRNPVARSPLLRRSGAHQPKRSTQRRAARDSVLSELDEWRDELDDDRVVRDGLEHD